MHKFRDVLCVKDLPKDLPRRDDQLGECFILACCSLFQLLATNYGMIKSIQQRNVCRLVDQEVFGHMFNPKVSYHIRNSVTRDPILDLLNLVHNLA